MPEGREERAKFRERLIEALRAHVRDVVAKRCALRLAILYGSFARGDWRPGSDADLLLVADGLPADARERWEMFYASVMGVPVEPHAFTPEEFEEMVRRGRMTAADALTEGVVLYAEPSYLSRVLALFERAKEELGLVKLGSAWLRRRRRRHRGS